MSKYFFFSSLVLLLHYLVQYVWKVLYKTNFFYFVEENILPENWTTILKRQKTTGLKGAQISPSIIKKN
jgi:hypothetical protein